MRAERRLRRALAVDAAASTAAAGAVLALAAPLADRLAVPTVAVVAAAVVMADWALLTGALSRARSAALGRWAPWVAAGNAACAVGCCALLATGIVDRGAWWLLVPPAIAMAELGAAQWVFARSSPTATAAGPVPVAA